MARSTSKSRSRADQSGKRRRSKPKSKGVSKASKKQRVEKLPTHSDNAGRNNVHLSWPTDLPYSIMLQIFRYAAYPLTDENFLGLATPTRWITRTARVCKSFMEPALAALYHTPPLIPPHGAHELLAHLQAQSEKSMINYRAKVKHLEISAVHFLTMKFTGKDPVNLMDLVTLVPQVNSIRLHLLMDAPGSLNDSLTYRVAPLYGEDLFAGLDRSGIRLHGWKWNYLIMKSDEMPWLRLTALHTRPSLSTIRNLEIAHLGIKGTKKHLHAQKLELSQSLQGLKSLRSLTFTKCTLMSFESLLDKAPQLASLKFIQCSDLTSTYLVELLKSVGRHLEVLVLKFNKALDLKFLSTLSSDCPSLRSLIMDFLIPSPVPVERELLFDELLPEGTYPTWPLVLEHIEMHYVRKWGVSQAGAFFESLEEAAATLSSLRVLIINSSVDIDWKDRLKFRNDWEARLKQAFQRKCTSPLRRQTAIDADSPPQTEEESLQELSIRKRNTRLQREIQDSAIASAPQLSDTNRQKHREGHVVQPMCHTVEVVIDNLRPMGRIFMENDFMDSAPSDDDDDDFSETGSLASG